MLFESAVLRLSWLTKGEGKSRKEKYQRETRQTQILSIRSACEVKIGILLGEASLEKKILKMRWR